MAEHGNAHKYLSDTLTEELGFVENVLVQFGKLLEHLNVGS